MFPWRVNGKHHFYWKPSINLNLKKTQIRRPRLSQEDDQYEHHEHMDNCKKMNEDNLPNHHHQHYCHCNHLSLLGKPTPYMKTITTKS